MDHFGEYLALGIDTIILALCCRQYIKNRRDVEALKDLPMLEVNSSLEELTESAPKKTIPYVAVRGKVKALGSPIHSINCPGVTGVVQKLSVKEHVTRRSTSGFWSEGERTVQEAYNTVPFVLKNGSMGIEVLDALDAELLELETLSDRYEPSSLGLMDHLWGFFAGVRQRGVQTTEELLREGVLITGYGELKSTGVSGNSLKLQKPSNGAPYFITTMPIKSIVRHLEQQRRTYGILTLIMGGIGIVIVGIIIRRLWKQKVLRAHQAALRKQLEEARRVRRREARDNDNLSELQLCVVCKLNPREVILLPCGHVCLCEDCSDSIEEFCPVCRARIESKSAAYIS